MKKKILIGLAALALSCGAVGTQALAAMETMKSHGHAYMTGGIGIDEREALEAMAKGFNMKIVFALTTGNFIADIAVTITTSAGDKVLETVSAGPWLYARLPPGAYSVKAQYKGTEKMRTIDVDSTLKSFLFHWTP